MLPSNRIKLKFQQLKTGCREISGPVKQSEVPLESWRQTETKYGNDYIYDFYFNANINGSVKKYIAKGIVRPDDIHKLKKGMLLSVKYSNNTPLKIAVTSVNY